MPEEESNDYVRFERPTATAPPSGLGSGRPNDAVRPQPLKSGRRAKPSRLSSADGEHGARRRRDDARWMARAKAARDAGEKSDACMIRRKRPIRSSLSQDAASP